MHQSYNSIYNCSYCSATNASWDFTAHLTLIHSYSSPWLSQCRLAYISINRARLQMGSGMGMCAPTNVHRGCLKNHQNEEAAGKVRSGLRDFWNMHVDSISQISFF